MNTMDDWMATPEEPISVFHDDAETIWGEVCANLPKGQEPFSFTSKVKAHNRFDSLRRHFRSKYSGDGMHILLKTSADDPTQIEVIVVQLPMTIEQLSMEVTTMLSKPNQEPITYYWKPCNRNTARSRAYLLRVKLDLPPKELWLYQAEMEYIKDEDYPLTLTGVTFIQEDLEE